MAQLLSNVAGTATVGGNGNILKYVDAGGEVMLTSKLEHVVNLI